MTVVPPATMGQLSILKSNNPCGKSKGNGGAGTGPVDAITGGGPMNWLVVKLQLPFGVKEAVMLPGPGIEGPVKAVTGGATFRVKFWVAVPAMFMAVMVIGNIPITIGVPDSKPVAGSKVTPIGSMLIVESVGAGNPFALKVRLGIATP